MDIEEHESGRYRFLRGISPYSSGVAATRGHEIVGVTFSTPVPWQQGLHRAVGWLDGIGQPSEALCGLTLRSPAPMSFEEFDEFNRAYREELAEAGVVVGDPNPLARTNVVPSGAALDGPSVLGFAAALPDDRAVGPTFVVAGAAELREGALEGDAIVRAGDVSADAVTEKAEFVLDVMEARLEGLGAAWTQVTVTNVYTRHSSPAWLDVVGERLGDQLAHGVRWYPSTPPVQGLEFEMDVRRLARELVVDAR